MLAACRGIPSKEYQEREHGSFSGLQSPSLAGGGLGCCEEEKGRKEGTMGKEKKGKKASGVPAACCGLFAGRLRSQERRASMKALVREELDQASVKKSLGRRR